MQLDYHLGVTAEQLEKNRQLLDRTEAFLKNLRNSLNQSHEFNERTTKTLEQSKQTHQPYSVRSNR